MRRIVTAVRSLIDRAPRLLPDALLIVGYLGLAWTLGQVNSLAGWAWLFAVPFLVGLAVEADSYRRRR